MKLAITKVCEHFVPIIAVNLLKVIYFFVCALTIFLQKYMASFVMLCGFPQYHKKILMGYIRILRV
jgi:hypothetical protein